MVIIDQYFHVAQARATLGLWWLTSCDYNTTVSDQCIKKFILVKKSHVLFIERSGASQSKTSEIQHHFRAQLAKFSRRRVVIRYITIISITNSRKKKVSPMNLKGCISLYAREFLLVNRRLFYSCKLEAIFILQYTKRFLY